MDQGLGYGEQIADVRLDPDPAEVPFEAQGLDAGFEGRQVFGVPGGAGERED
jgi:hypothetical protein